MSGSNKFQICHVIGSLDPCMGGLPKTTLALAAAQAAQGAETSLVFHASTPGLAEIRRTFAEIPGLDKIHFCELPSVGRWTGSPRELDSALDLLRPRILHVHGLWEPLLMWSQRHALRRGIPYVILPQSMLHPWQARHHRLAKWTLQNLLGWKRCWRGAAFIQTLSDAETAHWRAAGIDRCRQIPNGIFAAEEIREEADPFPGFADAPCLLSLARLHPQKNPELLLQAFAGIATAFPTHRLVFAGPDYGLRASLERQARRAGLEKRVIFAGPLSGPAKWTALRRCACFCLPSRAEGFSLALLEAALAGAPCLISPECYFRDLAQAGGALEVDTNPATWSEALRNLLTDERARERMGAAARAFVRTHYAWEEIADRLLRAYAEVLEEGW